MYFAERQENPMPTSSIFTNVKITDPKKAEAFINALDEAADAPYEKKERGESHILTDHEEIRKLMEKGLEDQANGKTRPLEEAIEDLRNKRQTPSGEFAEQILKELIDEGYSGYELLDEFRIRQTKVRPAVEAMLEEAMNVANGNGEYMSYEEFVKEVIEENDCDTTLSKNDLLRINAEKMDPIEYMGFQEGLEIGIQIGENNVNKFAALKLNQNGYKTEFIAECLKVSPEQVREWIEEK
ncbi:hypothetical protein [Bullifex sp.]|uniref:hypothetical protein n=1 Tax=Bullifex sp. TaxID=2815808 RepID=UPI002A7F5D68|nr:hypothetical protein [Bullifex sp.]MDY4067854.1 hypothetical protein [Bullifex sp.]